MTALQQIGEELATLSADALEGFALPDVLRDALLEAKRLPQSKFGALRRQMQYVGRLMREVDVAPIRARLADLQAPGKQANALHHLAERWRARLLADDSALNAFVNDFPDADRDALSHHIVAARDEQAKGKPPKHFRLLYQAIHARLRAGL